MIRKLIIAEAFGLLVAGCAQQGGGDTVGKLPIQILPVNTLFPTCQVESAAAAAGNAEAQFDLGALMKLCIMPTGGVLAQQGVEAFCSSIGYPVAGQIPNVCVMPVAVPVATPSPVAIPAIPASMKAGGNG